MFDYQRDNYQQQRLAADPLDPTTLDEEGGFGELEVAEYIVFLLAFDTYLRYLKEVAGEEAVDTLGSRGMALMREADRLHIGTIGQFLDANLASKAQKSMLARALALVPTPRNASKRALMLRTILSRGGTVTMKAVFQTTQARKAVNLAIEATMVEDADTALDLFAAVKIKNVRIRNWIDKAAELAGAGLPPGLVTTASQGSADTVQEALKERVLQQGAPAASDTAAKASTKAEAILTKVQNEAEQSARRAMQVSGQQDTPPTRSEVVGIATAAAVAIASDPDNLQNVPESLRKLDPEQRSAALTGGRVLVAAGAGAGKSTTLIARVKYLVEEKGVSPNRILVCSFNKKAADELKSKLVKALGEKGREVIVGTMNSLFQRFILGNPQSAFRGYGTPDEKGMLSGNRLIAPPQDRQGGGRQDDDEIRGKKPTPLHMTTAIRGIWRECTQDVEAFAKHFGVPVKILAADAPKAKSMNVYLSKWQGNDVSLEEAKASAKRPDEMLAAIWYEFYLGIKGDLGRNWRPPCGSSSKPFNKFMGDFRRGGERLGDMNDQIKILRDILRRDPSAKRAIQERFDHFLVDECVHEDTEVALEGGAIKRVKDVQPGDAIASFENGKVRYKQVLDKKLSHRSNGYKIRTAGGAELDMTANHRIYATSPEVAGPDETYLYLMYRKDLGFRIGVSDRPTRRNKGGSISRACAERADALWVVAKGSTSEMLYLEQAYSLEYGIPTQLFEGAVRGLDQARIDRVFEKYGTNGRKLLDEKGLDFDYPNWVNDTASTDRITINVNAHRPGYNASGTTVAFSWTGSSQVGDEYVYKLKGGRSMFNRRLASYVEARRVALELASKTGGRIRESISVQGEDCFLVTASALFPGMSVPVRLPDGNVTLDRIETIVESTGVYYDLSIQDTANFFGNRVLSHNCQDLNGMQHDVFDKMSEHIEEGSNDRSIWMIGDEKQAIYQFRGAQPDLFAGLAQKPGWTVAAIRTNYRCAPEIVEVANRLIANNETVLPIEQRANPSTLRGQASVVVNNPDSNATAAITTVSRIRKDLDTDTSNRPEDYAVLARTNSELNDFETACIINEIPYVRRGGKGFLDAPESKAVLGYIDLANGASYESKAESLAHCLLHPDRGVFMGADDVAKAVKEALDDVARQERVDAKSVDPTLLITDKKYARILANNIKVKFKIAIVNSQRGNIQKGEWLYNKLVDELAGSLMEMGRQVKDVGDLLQEEGVKTHDLISHILDKVTGTKKFWDHEQRREVVETISLRDHISDRMALGGDDDDEEGTDETDEKPEINEEGLPKVEQKAAETGKGLGAVQFLYAMTEPNKNDVQNATDPTLANGFQKKLQRYAEAAKKLRIDPGKWAKEQRDITDPKLRQEKPPAMVLSTVHSVKGLEWENVTVLMPKGRFPLERKPKPGDLPPDPEEVAKERKAERNLAYVAITRAAKNLEIHAIPDPKTREVSPFVIETGLTPGENVPKTVEVGPGGSDSIEPSGMPKEADYMGFSETSDYDYDRKVS
jgi:superfamily I DNA/RNA helicase